MRCYYVLVHGTLSWQTAALNDDDLFQPRGFYCHRYVLASDERNAAEIVFRRVRANLDKDSHWLSTGRATRHLEAEGISTAPIHKLLAPDNRGHTFYDDDD